MQDCLLSAKRKFGGAKIHYTGIYNTHAIGPMYALKVCRVNGIYRKAVKDNTPGVSYINKLGLRCDPSGPNDVIHWCSDHATKVALYTLKKRFKLNDGSESNQDSLPIVSSPPSSSASGLLNLSKYKLNSGCESLLAKGIKYIPAPRVTKRIEVEEAYSNFARRLKLSFFFNNKKSWTRDQKFRPTSNFNPPDNLDRQERTAIKTLKQNKDIIIKPTDKGAAIVVIDKTDYVGEAERQLANQVHYKRLEEPVFQVQVDTKNKRNFWKFG